MAHSQHRWSRREGVERLLKTEYFADGVFVNPVAQVHQRLRCFLEASGKAPRSRYV